MRLKGFFCLYLIGFCLIHNTVIAQEKRSESWKEVSRVDDKHKPISFKDTIHLTFMEGNEYTWMKKGSFIFRGTYKVKKGWLDLGNRVFSIVERNNQSLVLKDNGATYYFKPYVPPARGKIEKEEYSGQVSSLDGLNGVWSVFKRTSSSTLKEIDYTSIVKSLALYDAPNDKGEIGYISGGKDPKGNPSWYIEKFENSSLICNGASMRVFEVLKADPKELIVKEGDITYFLKRFKQ